MTPPPAGQHGGTAPGNSAAPGSGGAQDPTQLIDQSIKHAELLAAQRRYEDALDALAPGFSVDPQNPGLIHMRAWLLVNLWRLREARVILEQLLGAHPNNDGSRSLLANALLRLGLFTQAEHEINLCLAQTPNDPFYLLLKARVLLGLASEGARKRKHRREARALVDQALAFASGNAEVFDEASRVLWKMGRAKEAHETTKLGLTEAPQHPGLLELHALLTAANTPAGKNDGVQQETVLADQMGKLLTTDPQHRVARTALFTQFWYWSMLHIDSKMSLTAIASLGIVLGFSTSAANPFGVALWWGIAAMFGGIQWLRYRAVHVKVAGGFRRSIVGSRPIDSARRWGERIVVVLLISTGVLAYLLAVTWRDAVGVRWIIVILCLTAALAVATSVLWQLGYLTRARRFEGVPTDREAVLRLAAHRREISGQIFVRCFQAVGLWALFLIVYAIAGFAQGRGDVRAVFFIATAGMVLSPLIGWFTIWLAEFRARGELGEAITINAKAPALWSPALAASLAAGMVIMLGAGLFTVPVAPNEHDAIGQYERKQPRENTGDEDSKDTCSGSKGARLACLLRKTQERVEKPIDMPNVQPLDLPDLPDFSDLPDLKPRDLPNLSQLPSLSDSNLAS